MEMVIVQNGEARTTSLVIADGTGVEHASVMKLARTYYEDLREFGPCRFEIDVAKRKQGGGTPVEFATLNEPQATLLMTYMKNTPIVRTFKKNLVRAFYDIFHRCHDILPDPDQNIKQSRLIELLELENKYLKQLHGTPARIPKDPNFLFKRFQEVGGGLSVNKWVKMVNIPYTAEAVNSVLYRNQRASAPMVASLMKALRFEDHEIAEHTAGLRNSPAPALIKAEMPKPTAKPPPQLPPPPPATEELFIWPEPEPEPIPKKGGERMNIDIEATKAKIRASGRTCSGWARSHGFDTLGAASKFLGRVKFTTEELDALRKDDLLVELK